MKGSRTSVKRASACPRARTTKKKRPRTRKTSRRTNKRETVSSGGGLLLGEHVVAPPEIHRRVSERQIAVEAAMHPGSAREPYLAAPPRGPRRTAPDTLSQGSYWLEVVMCG